MKEVTEAAGVSIRTGYKWLARHEGEGEAGRRGIELCFVFSLRTVAASRKSSVERCLARLSITAMYRSSPVRVGGFTNRFYRGDQRARPLVGTLHSGLGRQHSHSDAF